MDIRNILIGFVVLIVVLLAIGTFLASKGQKKDPE
jgi:hypothetical protein